MLKKLLNKDTIKLDIVANDWKEAIFKGCEILLDKGYIEKKYIDSIIKNIEENGPYIVITKGVAFPHSKPEDGVNHLAMSLVTLKEPVYFGHEQNDPVRLVITLAAVDSNTHLSALSKFISLLRSSEDIEKIINSKTKEEVIKIIEKF
ncbi:PTS sugar transporter subunit IIA [Thermohalobacter berrensis]|uniref:Ascorbate-specific PTS system EIIA component n=1 Tax=Thermohalobacter berrensis TaxID=99594 RepID=A0A419T172_9FIRM|nr:PTS sugar transporter subunit IIA [Thermohalobacter berrensis]RKD31217.1 PTS mannitol transporter subunit IIA [Thermohalobacter berrensis]